MYINYNLKKKQSIIFPWKFSFFTLHFSPLESRWKKIITYNQWHTLWTVILYKQVFLKGLSSLLSYSLPPLFICSSVVLIFRCEHKNYQGLNSLNQQPLLSHTCSSEIQVQINLIIFCLECLKAKIQVSPRLQSQVEALGAYSPPGSFRLFPGFSSQCPHDWGLFSSLTGERVVGISQSLVYSLPEFLLLLSMWPPFQQWWAESLFYFKSVSSWRKYITL